MPKKITPLADRLFSKVEMTLFCWEWQGAINAAGYGVIGAGRRGEGNKLVHRAVYELLVGPVPDDHDLDHLCRNRRCCNPDHLEPVARQVNVDRGLRAKGYRDHITTCPRGHEYDCRNEKQRWCRTCVNENARARYHAKKEAKAS